MARKDIAKQQSSTAPVLRLPGGRRVVARPGKAVRTGHKQVDLCFVFDTTGSMSNKIDGLVRCMDSLVTDLGRLALDWRVTTVPFGDLTVPGDDILGNEPFVTDVATASRQLRTMRRFSGGGNLGESAVEAMLSACRKPYRDQAVVVVVLITDEPALGDEQSFQSVDQALSLLDAACFTVATDTSYYKRWATEHGGEWRLVADAVDTDAISRLFQSLMKQVVNVTDAVHRLGGGSVRAYLDSGD